MRRIIMNPMERSEEPTIKERTTDLQVTRAVDASIQDRATRADETGSMLGIDMFSSLVRAGQLIAPWWSFRRDTELRQFWKTSNHLAGAVYAMESMISNIDFQVLPSDPSVASQVRMANERRRILLESPEFGKGWQEFISKWVEDLVTTDNGAFAEIIGPGDPAGPIMGAPISMANLDSHRCHRTSDPIYPVIYWDTDGRRYKLHYTRVLFASQMPSTKVEMNGVGFCSCSRAIDVAQNLIDIAQYKMEKLGSRPPRQLLIGEKGITAAEIWNAFANAAEQDDSVGLSRYRRMVAIAPKQGRGEVRLSMLDLASVPDGFDEETSTTLGMYTIALAFGVDAREIWPATTSGATKADAALQHLKARGKGKGQILQQIERQINQKFLPESLTFKFDFQDDEQDMLQAEIRQERSVRHERDVNIGIITVRTAREQMLADGDLTESQFEAMELEDGRLPSGDSVLTLFYTQDRDIKQFLIDPDVALSYNKLENTNQDEVLEKIANATLKAQQAIAQEGWSTKKQKARQALAALEYLREKWEEGREEEETVDEQEATMVTPEAEGQEEEADGDSQPYQQTAADAERRRNESNYRGDSDSEAFRAVVGRQKT